MPAKFARKLLYGQSVLVFIEFGIFQLQLMVLTLSTSPFHSLLAPSINMKGNHQEIIVTLVDTNIQIVFIAYVSQHSIVHWYCLHDLACMNSETCSLLVSVYTYTCYQLQQQKQLKCIALHQIMCFQLDRLKLGFCQPPENFVSGLKGGLYYI